MQNLKIYKKSPVMRNIALFAMFSVFYLHVVESFVRGVSTFSIDSYIDFFITHKMLLITLFVFCSTLFAGRKFSRYFYLAFIFQCIYLAFGQYLVALDKFILILNFFYLILSYYFFLFMNSDLEEASNTPNVKSEDMYSSLSISTIIKMKKGDDVFEASLINWDESTCFLRVEGDISRFAGKVDLSWEFENVLYESKGLVVSGAKNIGVGIRLMEGATQSFGWSEFYDIINSRGYSPILTA